MKKYSPPAIPIQGIFILLFFGLFACQQMEEEELLQFTIDRVEYISEGSYLVTCTLAATGGGEITAHGICWGESEHPDIEGYSIELGPPEGTGEFSLLVSGLLCSTDYYFRSYAVIRSAPFYTDEKAFTTRPSEENLLMDINKNIYKTVQIGEQTWMASNLKVTRYADGTAITFVEDQGEWYHFTRDTAAYCWYDNVRTNGYAYGALYTWPAAVGRTPGSELIPSGIQGVCPDGWHIPSDGEWKQLEKHLGMSQTDANSSKWRGVDQGAQLKEDGSRRWTSPNISLPAEVGFEALPGGFRHGSGEFMELNNSARFWTSSGRGYGFAWVRGLDYDKATVYREFTGVYRGHSVRCVKDAVAQ